MSRATKSECQRLFPHMSPETAENEHKSTLVSIVLNKKKKKLQSKRDQLASKLKLGQIYLHNLGLAPSFIHVSR